VSCQHVLTGSNFEKSADQKKDSNIQRKEHKHKHQICLGTPHKKQEYHKSPPNKIEPDGNIVCGGSSSLCCITGGWIGWCDTPDWINKDPKTEEEGRECPTNIISSKSFGDIRDEESEKVAEDPFKHRSEEEEDRSSEEEISSGN